MKLLKTLATTLILSLPVAANAVPLVVWDQSPDAVGGSITSGYWSNSTSSQNFADIVNFANDIQITGMDIFTGNALGSLGDTGTVRVRSGSHTATPIEFTETVSVIDSDGTGSAASLHRIHVDFTNPLELVGGVDYWIGLSGTSTNWVQAGISGGTGPLLNNSVARYMDTTFITFATDVQDQAFRLWSDDGTSVPAPGTIALLGLGLVGLGMTRRKKLG